MILERDGATIRGAYPFTQSATRHSVTFVRRERTLNTMCAIDALGAGVMCREDTMIRSGCHLCGVPVIVETRNRGIALDEVRPRSAVVWAGFRASRGCAAASLCTALVFFWLHENPAQMKMRYLPVVEHHVRAWAALTCFLSFDLATRLRLRQHEAR